ncbi:MAG: methylated-DNA--[protein]-cysteine S-methyltransferase [Nakamurella sp.]
MSGPNEGDATTDADVDVDVDGDARIDDARIDDGSDGAEPNEYDDVPARGAAVGFAVFDTALGVCGIAWGPGGVTGVQLPEGSADEVREQLTTDQPGAPEAEPTDAVRSAIERIQALLSGESHDDLADITLDLADLASFLQRTYAITRTITPGHTLTYGQIAERLGSPGLARAVGRAMGANPCPIIVPCHRVLGADGSIGGFSAHGGATTKRRMLLVEGVAEHEGPALFGADELYGHGTADN